MAESAHRPNSQSIHAGQWYVAAYSTALPPGKTLVRVVADQEIVFWRGGRPPGGPEAAAAVCPHWGGPLGEGAVGADGRLTCPWHGWQFQAGRCLDKPRLQLPRYLAHDDGILLWVRLPFDMHTVTTPPLQARPRGARSFWFDICIESDVYHIQENYLDFLHPAAYHQRVFDHCSHMGKEGEINLVELGYRMPLGRSLRVHTRVWAPTPYQVRNEVYAGLGAGTVIESHITPIHTGRSIIHEIYHVPAAVAPAPIWPLVRSLMKRSALQIRREDAIFSHRRYRLRQLGFVDGRGLPVNGKVAPYLEQWADSPQATRATAKLADLAGQKASSHWQ